MTIHEHRTRSQEDAFVKALYYAFGCQDNGHACDPYSFASWHSLRWYGRAVRETFRDWQTFTPEVREELKNQCMRSAYVAPGCKIEVTW